MKYPLLAIALTFALLSNLIGQQPGQSPAASPTTSAVPSPTPPGEPSPAPSPTPPANPVPAPEVKKDDDSDVVRITTNLVQVDATITDRDGKQVTDLTAADFEILENGRPRVITNFSYVSTVATPSAAATPKPVARDRKMPPRVVGQLHPEQVKRAIALVVDDLRMSVEAIATARQALRKFVDEQAQPGDLVAIIRTSGGMDALQQFTSDRQQLTAAIERIRPMARVGSRPGAFTSVSMLDRLETQISDGTPHESEDTADRRRREGSTTGGGQSALRGTEESRIQGINEFRDTLFTVGTIGALNFVVRGLKELPGRKAVVLFSDGIAIFNSDTNAGDRSGRVLSAMRQLVDHANRASVVLYAIDTRGLQPTMSASDNTGGGPLVANPIGPASAVTGVGNISPDLFGQQVLGARTAEMFEGQNGLSYLARETGGLAVFNNNDLNRGIRRALEDISGYYLIGYRPDDASFETTEGYRRYNTWTIKVKNRSDLRVRTRSGFIGVAEDLARNKKRTSGEQLMAALLSPFSARGLDLQLTSFFMNDATVGSTVRSVMLMDATKLTFTPQPDGRQATVLQIIGVTLGDNGTVIDQVSRIENISVSPENLERFQREGMVYGLNVPISKPGAYLLRIAVRDAASGRIGSASQFIEVPNVTKDQLTLSSLVISGNNPARTARPKTAKDLVQTLLKTASASSSNLSAANASTAPTIVAGGEGMTGNEDPLASPASRRFRTRMYLDFACLIYNGKNDKAKRTQFTTQVRLFNDGQEVFIGELVPLDMSQQYDLKRLVIARRLYLGTILTAGDYVLHLTVSEPGASGKGRVATRWTDFKVIE